MDRQKGVVIPLVRCTILVQAIMTITAITAQLKMQYRESSGMCRFAPTTEQSLFNYKAQSENHNTSLNTTIH